MQRPTRIEPKSGQESVWDYPRPPRIERAKRLVTVELAGIRIAYSSNALRVLETAGAPTYYVPAEDVETALLRRSTGQTTWCEWKGVASYFDIVGGDTAVERAAWTYLDPTPPFQELKDRVSFYPSRVECYLDDERVAPQPGGYYGGWVTADIAGPFKGEPGTESW